MNDDTSSAADAVGGEVGALLRATVNDVRLPDGFLDGVRRRRTRDRVRRSSAGVLAVVGLAGILAALGTGSVGFGASHSPPATLRVSNPGPSPSASAAASRSTANGPESAGSRDATFTPAYLPAGYAYQADRVAPTPPGDTDTTQTVSDRSWQSSDPLAAVIDIDVTANDPGTPFPVVPAGVGPTVRGHPSRLTDGPALLTLDWNDTPTLAVTITAIRRSGGVATLTTADLTRVADGLVLAAETPGGRYGLDPRSPAPEGALFDTDAADPSAGATHTVLYMAPFSQPAVQPNTHMELQVATLDVTTGTLRAVEGTIGSGTDNTAKQRAAGFHALLPFGAFAGARAMTVGWVIGPVTRVTATIKGRLLNVDTSGWTVDPNLRMLAVPGAPKGTVLDAYGFDGKLLYTSKVSS